MQHDAMRHIPRRADSHSRVRATRMVFAVARDIDIHTLTVLDLDLSDTRLLTLNLSHVNAGLKSAKVAPVVGVLGADVLWRHHAVIDYERGFLLLSK